jgi:hypothetical protein
MSVQEIESAITQLSALDFAKLAEWFDEFRERQWDEQIEHDSAAGKLDHFIDGANREFEAGRCKPL